MKLYFGYNEAVHYAAAKLGVLEYIANEMEGLDMSVWELINNFEDDAGSVIQWGLYEHLHDLRNPPPPLATFYVIKCTNGCYRLPNETESEFINGKTTVSA